MVCKTRRGVGDNPTPVTTFETNNSNLGHYLGDNSRELYLALQVKPVKALSPDLSYLKAVKGNVAPYVYNAPAPVDQDPFMDEVDSAFAEFYSPGLRCYGVDDRPGNLHIVEWNSGDSRWESAGVGVTTYTLLSVTENTQGTPRTSTTTIFGDPVTVTVLPKPQPFTVGGGGERCEGDGVNITLSGSESFYTYELYENGSPTGIALPDTGSDLVFTVGPALSPATYNFTIWAYRTELPDCELQMTGTV